MGKSSRQAVGIIALLTIIACSVLFSLLHIGQAATAPGISLGNSVQASIHSGTSSGTAGTPPVIAGRHSSAAADTVPTAQLPEPSAGTIAAVPTVVIMQEIVVHVAGAVKKPGVYHLHPGARNEDALKAAGGASSDASPDAIDLAAHPDDGMQLYFPTRKEHPNGGADAMPTAVTAAGKTKLGTKGSVSHVGAAHGLAGGKADKLTSPGQGQVNINSASAAELMRLPGIGPAMAARILDYRKQNGAFKSPDDLNQVSGIGEKKLAKLIPFVRIK